jgi:hypothetical protein
MEMYFIVTRFDKTQTLPDLSTYYAMLYVINSVNLQIENLRQILLDGFFSHLS